MRLVRLPLQKNTLSHEHWSCSANSETAEIDRRVHVRSDVLWLESLLQDFLVEALPAVELFLLPLRGGQARGFPG